LLRKKEHDEYRKNEREQIDRNKMSVVEPSLHGVVERQGIEKRCEEGYSDRSEHNDPVEVPVPVRFQLKQEADVTEEYADDDEGQELVQIAFRIIGPDDVSDGYTDENDDKLNMKIVDTHSS
jgi:hypothetical protein